MHSKLIFCHDIYYFLLIFTINNIIIIIIINIYNYEIILIKLSLDLRTEGMEAEALKMYLFEIALQRIS